MTNDTTLLLARGTTDSYGLAVISGTGFMAYAKHPSGAVGRCGGWGGLLGDEGSAYTIALRALRAACQSHDGIGPRTRLIDALVKRMNVSGPPDFIPAVACGAWDRTAIAGLAPLVLELAAEGDATAPESCAAKRRRWHARRRTRSSRTRCRGTNSRWRSPAAC